jgi:hypothetical protein
MKPPFRLKHVATGLYFSGPASKTLNNVGKVYHATGHIKPYYYYDENGKLAKVFPDTFVMEECDVIPRSKFLEAIQAP